jgi:hypothetical protein
MEEEMRAEELRALLTFSTQDLRKRRPPQAKRASCQPPA